MEEPDAKLVIWFLPHLVEVSCAKTSFIVMDLSIQVKYVKMATFVRPNQTYLNTALI